MEIIDLASKRLLQKSKNTVFYLSQDLKWFSDLQSGVPLQVIPVQNMDSLKYYAGLRTPDLVVVDKVFCGEDPKIICQIQQYCEVPIILVAPKEKKSSRFIKQAYMNGIHDVLFDPVSREEWREMMAAFLRILEIQTLKH